MSQSFQNYLSCAWQNESLVRKNYVVNTVVFHCSTQLNLIISCDFQIKCVCLEGRDLTKLPFFSTLENTAQSSFQTLLFRALLPGTLMFIAHSPVCLEEAAINWVVERGYVYLKTSSYTHNKPGQLHLQLIYMNSYLFGYIWLGWQFRVVHSHSPARSLCLSLTTNAT